MGAYVPQSTEVPAPPDRPSSGSFSARTLRTVLGLKHLAWNEIEAPVLLRPVPLLIHLIVRPKARSFFALRTKFGVVARLHEVGRHATALSSFIAVREGTVFSG